LGHPTDPVLNVLKNTLQIKNESQTEFCVICQRAKHTREPFPLSDHTSSKLDDLVTLDLWGPYKVTSSKGLPSSVLNGKSPYEMIYKKTPTLSHLRVFGYLCFSTIVNNHDKLGSRSEKCVMIGYSNFKKGYRLYSLDKHQFIFSRDVKFFESVFPFKDTVSKKVDTSNVFQDINHIIFFDNDYPKMSNDDERVYPNLNSDYKSQSDSSHSFMPGGGVNTTDFPSNNSRNDADSSDDIFDTKRSSRQSVSLRNYNDFVVESKVKHELEKYVGYSKLNSENYYFVTQLNQNCDPKSFFKASKFSHWTDAMNNEMDALLRNDTWDIVDLPKDVKSIGSFGQKEEIDYEEIFSPIVKIVTVRCLLNIVVSNSWHVFQFDVNNVFLYGDLVETVYMKPPEGYFSSGNKVQRKSNYSLYTKSDKRVFLALLIYVDDIIITGCSVSKDDKFKVFLKSKFMIKDLGKLKYFLGIEVIDIDKGICLNQRKYVLDLLSEYGMLACKLVKTPLMSKLAISNEATDDDPILDNITNYQKLMGKLFYLTNTRPDISYDVYCLNQFMHSPLKSHLKISFKILRYFKSCPRLGIHIVKSSGMSLKDFSDDDWAKYVVTRRLVTGYCVFLMVLLFHGKAKSRILSLSPQLK
ncbi:ribonuclease H-like domain-containing protein, partial [Tanacetum coccineum]